MQKVDFAIIGGGIIGLSIANLLLKKFPEQSIVIFEKEKFLGEHNSSRNSGVLHAGLYYPTSSLKHNFCQEGLMLWREIANELNIPIQKCGKFIVARNNPDLESLEQTFKQAKLNSVIGIKRANKDEVQALKQKLHCEAALFSPETSIMDAAAAINQLKSKVEQLGGIILPFNPVLNISSEQSGFTLETVTEKVWTQKLINVAGLMAISLRKKLNLHDLEDYWVKGNYLKTTQKNEFQTLIYPTPAKELKGLGIHLTFDFADQMKFGPDTQQFDAKMGVHYKMENIEIELIKESVKTLFKTIDPDRLTPDYCGIRPKIKLNGELHTDFWIKSPLENYIECCGIESPGLTSAPAIARYITSKLV